MKQKNGQPTASKQRKPQQQRSKARTEAILNAAKELIQEKGSSRLKIQEIASRAGITAGSMYQYFPNKEAIILTLLEQYMEQIDVIFANIITEVGSIADLVEMLDNLHSQYYELFKNNPIYQDITASWAADKTISQRDIEDSLSNANKIFEVAKHLFPQERHQELQQVLLLMMHTAPNIIRLAINLKDDETEAMIATSKKLLLGSVVHLSDASL
ncbi:MAG: TetR/AcrR family transcriptional regulator [Chloroflexota bacterium]